MNPIVHIEPTNRGIDLTSNLRLLDRFYSIFAFMCVVLLTIGVPFIFVRKAGGAIVTVLLLALVIGSWRISRAENPQLSIKLFASLAWLLAVASLYLGLPNTIVVFVMAVAVILAVVAGLRAGVLFGATYLLAWVAYIVMVARGVAPTPYFLGGSIVSWFHGVIAFLIVLLPVPEMVANMRAAVSERERAEMQLREALVFNETILLNSPVAMGVYKGTGPCILANQAYADLVGATIDQLLKQDFHAIRAWQLTGMLDDILLMLADGNPRRRDIHATTSFGKEIWIDTLMMSTVLHGETHLLIQLLDHTEQKRSEQALRESEERLAMAMEASSLSIWDLDTGSGIVRFDSQWRNIVGGTSDVTKVTVAELERRIHPSDLERIVKRDLAAVRSTDGNFDEEFRFKTEAGTWKWIRCSGKIVERDAHGRVVRAIGTNLDITERKHSEAAKQEFVSIVSHELRTPLTSIAGGLGLVAGGKLGPLPAPMQSMIAIAYRNCRRLIALVNDLLDIEKLSEGKIVFDMQVQEIMPLVIQAIDMIQPYGVKRGVNVVLAGDSSESEALIDSQRLIQALSNLLSNAIKYSPDGGDVVVRVTIWNGFVRIAVTDQGPGIPEAFRARIFEKFSQADSSDTRLKEGTGLGLAIAREMVHKMMGEIDYHSVPGQGSCFFITIPLA